MDILQIEDLTTGVIYDKTKIRIEEDPVRGRRVHLSVAAPVPAPTDAAPATATDATAATAAAPPDRILTKTSNVRVTYTCATCQRENAAKFCSFWKKWHRDRSCCTTCTGLAPDQLAGDKVAQSEADFADGLVVDEVFKKAYWRKYLDADEFARLAPKMVSFQHDKFDLGNGNSTAFNYVPAFSVASQFRFVPMMYDTARDALEKPQFFRWKCDDCTGVFETKELCSMKNKHKVLCPSCNVSNTVMKITTLKNATGEPVTYATKYEHKFLKWCLDNKVRVLNGHLPGMYLMPDAPGSGPDTTVRMCVLKNKPSWTHKLGKGPNDVFPDTYVAFCKSLLQPGQKEAWREKREAHKEKRRMTREQETAAKAAAKKTKKQQAKQAKQTQNEPPKTLNTQGL